MAEDALQIFIDEPELFFVFEFLKLFGRHGVPAADFSGRPDKNSGGK